MLINQKKKAEEFLKLQNMVSQCWQMMCQQNSQPREALELLNLYNVYLIQLRDTPLEQELDLARLEHIHQHLLSNR